MIDPLDALKKTMEGAYGDLEPDGDPAPLGIIVKGGGDIQLLAVDPSYMRDPDAKTRLLGRLMVMARAKKATGVFFCTPVVMAEIAAREHESAEEARRRIHGTRLLQDCPGTTEFLLIWEIRPDGIIRHYALVHRGEGQPPRLGDWSLLDTAGAIGIEDRFAPVQAILADNAKGGN